MSDKLDPDEYEKHQEYYDHRDQRARMRVIENRRVNRRSPRL